MDILNKEQKLVVNTNNISLVNIAGPGSGKTKTLISKISYILENKLVNNINDLLVLTFTNNAAEEIKDRVLKDIKLNNSVKYFGTYHSIFRKFLIEEDLLKIEFNNFEPTIISTNEIIRNLKTFFKNEILTKDKIWNNVIKFAIEQDFEVNKLSKPKKNITNTLIDYYIFNIKDILQVFERKINFLTTFDIKELETLNFKNVSEYVTKETLIEIRKKLNDKENQIFVKKQELFNLIDVDYFIKTFELILNKMISYKIDQKLIVFSDLLLLTLLNLNKYPKWNKELKEKFKFIFVDEFQDTNIIQNEILKLISNKKNICVIGDPYQSIYSFLGAEIKNIIKAKKTFNSKTIQLLKNYRSNDNIVELTNSLAQKMEEKIIDWKPCHSNGLVKNHTIKYKLNMDYQLEKYIIEIINNIPIKKNIAIIQRSGFTSLIEKELIINKIPFIKYGGISIQEAIEVQIIINLFNYVYNNEKTHSLKIIFENFPGIGDISINKYFKNNKSNTKIDYLLNILKRKDITNKNHKKLLFDFYENDIFPYISKGWSNKRFQEAEKRLAVLKDNILELDTESDILNFFEEFLLSEHQKNKKERVVITTIHSAKGLEWDVVIMSDAGSNSYTRDSIEEAQRLNYVAISRAKEELYLLSKNSNIFQISDEELKNNKLFEDLDQNNNKDNNKELCIRFGKNKGIPFSDLNYGYLKWLWENINDLKFKRLLNNEEVNFIKKLLGI